MSNRTGLTVLALAAVSLASGCGGSKGLSRTELVARADPICRRINEKIDSSKLTRDNFARVARSLAAYEQQSTAELAKLAPPASMAGDWKTIVDDFQTIGEQLAAIGRAKGPKEAVPSGSTISRAQTERTEVAHRDGFNYCARF